MELLMGNLLRILNVCRDLWIHLLFFNQISLLQAWTKALFSLGEAVWAELPVERVTQGLRACQLLP